MSGVVDAVGSVVSDVGNAIGSAAQSVGNFVGQAAQDVGTGLASVDKGVGSVPGGWGTLAGLAAAPLTGGASLGEMIGTDAAGLAAQGLGEAQIAQILGDSYGIDAMAAADAAGLASSGIGASQIASTIAQSYPEAIGNVAQAASSGAGGLQNLLGYAKTGAQIVGGLGKVAGGVAGLSQGRVSPQQADPFGQYRSGLAAQLNNLLQNPSTITTTPGYQFNLSQGLQQLQAQQAKQGRLVSGGGLLEAQQFGQQFAQSNLSQQQQLLAQLSGANQSAAGGTQAIQNVGLANTANLFGGVGAIAQGLGVATGQSPLDTLYSNYNKPSPSANA